jgi:hypothetical protein
VKMFLVYYTWLFKKKYKLSKIYFAKPTDEDGPNRTETCCLE